MVRERHHYTRGDAGSAILAKTCPSKREDQQFHIEVPHFGESVRVFSYGELNKEFSLWREKNGRIASKHLERGKKQT